MRVDWTRDRPGDFCPTCGHGLPTGEWCNWCGWIRLPEPQREQLKAACQKAAVELVGVMRYAQRTQIGGRGGYSDATEIEGFTGVIWGHVKQALDGKVT